MAQLKPSSAGRALLSPQCVRYAGSLCVLRSTVRQDPFLAISLSGAESVMAMLNSKSLNGGSAY